MGRATKGNTRDGFALLTALWLIVAISIVGLQFSLESRDARRSAMYVSESARGRAAAAGGIDLVRARLDKALELPPVTGAGANRLRAFDPWLDIDTLYSGSMEIGGTAINVRVRDAGKLLNINRASEEEFRTFFTTLYIDYSLADELAQTILDWRDTDDLTRARGAERDQYLADERLELPRNGNFQDIEELLYVKGMTPEVFEMIRPFITVTGSGQVNVNSAEPQVLMSLPGMTEAAVYELLSMRGRGERARSITDIQQYLNTQGARAAADRARLSARITFDVRELEIESLAAGGGGATGVRMVSVVRRTARRSAIVWRRVD